jgi:hypothetical protein
MNKTAKVIMFEHFLLSLMIYVVRVSVSAALGRCYHTNSVVDANHIFAILHSFGFVKCSSLFIENYEESHFCSSTVTT